ncbi:gamma carbonic anhydrase family protein [Nitratifractor salsuginis]|uniref:Hexapeptide repeat-containing transferase n=1 Tax=Nitratifractor salsuginis (strain DSM 16511 / JCM 12458 / E9I37-1) TaxID=749222 RepID=E6X379_NITSE|nr:gamma carbonic anhydrase family protein [Nitratifractor salsuginis]ADV47292.1 hexapeptide repeat-containing transferase [Nitratifractor salsuginis DSM 16511]
MPRILEYQGMSPKLGAGSWIAPGATVIGDVELGEDASIWFGCVVRGDVHRIRIGARSNIQDLSMIHVTHYKNPDKSDGHPTIIGDDVTVGHRVMLHGCTVEDACLIGMSATILDGAIIGRESIVGAGALVTGGKIFPPRSLILGSPAKVVRQLSDEEVAELYASARRYVEFMRNYRK